MCMCVHIHMSEPKVAKDFDDTHDEDAVVDDEEC